MQAAVLNLHSDIIIENHEDYFVVIIMRSLGLLLICFMYFCFVKS